MKSKSAKDLYEQGMKLMEECSSVGWNGSDYSPESIKRMELIHSIVRRYVDNIVLYLTGSYWLPNDKYDTKVSRYIYARF